MYRIIFLELKLDVLATTETAIFNKTMSLHSFINIIYTFSSSKSTEKTLLQHKLHSSTFTSFSLEIKSETFQLISQTIRNSLTPSILTLYKRIAFTSSPLKLLPSLVLFQKLPLAQHHHHHRIFFQGVRTATLAVVHIKNFLKANPY